MKKKSFVTPVLEKSMLKLRHSWQWVRQDFSKEFEFLLKDPTNLSPEGPGELIWQTRNKYVLLLTLPDTGRRIVYKTTPRIKRAHQYCHRRSPFANEAWFYQQLSSAGFPMAQLLAAGDIRENFILKSGFLMTEFAENCHDGRDFCPGGCLEHDSELKDAFISSNMRLLAKMHNMRILHRGSTPANFLYRLNDGTLEIIWIDVASCHYKPFFLPFRNGVVRDLSLFFSYLQLPYEELLKYIRLYLSETNKKYTAESLAAAIQKRL